MEIVSEMAPNKFTSKISIKPFVPQGSQNMGLEKFDMAVHEGITHSEPIICLTVNNIKRYITGLNEFAPEVQMLDALSKKTKIKQIRDNVVYLEKMLGSNVIDPKAEDFWDKVKTVRPDNHVFWDKFIIKVGNKPTFFSPKRSTDDFIKIIAIQAGGFSLVAPSLEAAKAARGKYRFYLDKEEETVSFKTEFKKLRNKALAELQKLDEKNQNKMYYVAKVLEWNSSKFTKKTPSDYIYNSMDAYINGEGSERSKEKAANNFIDAVLLDAETLKLKAIVKDAHLFKFIVARGDGHIYHRKTNNLLGDNSRDVVEYLKNPLNDEVLGDIMKGVEKKWQDG